MKVRALLWTLTAVALTIGLRPSAGGEENLRRQPPDGEPRGAATSLDEAWQTALEDYAALAGTDDGAYIEDVRAEDDFAYAVACVGEDKDGAAHASYAVFLARQSVEVGWHAVAPHPARAGAYNALLEAFPEWLIDEATQAYLHVPEDTGTRALNPNQHRLPWPAARVGTVLQKGGAGHENQVDFNIPGSVYASREGTVVFLKESSNTRCQVPPPDPCWKKANMVVVQHADGTYSWYVHLAWNSVPVALNSRVNLGTRIGIEGNTGYTLGATGVHLHYMVSTGHMPWTNPTNANDAPWAQNIFPVDFVESTWANLAVNNNYTSQNASDVSVARQGNGRVDLFVQGEDNKLWRRPFANNAWGAWEDLGGILTSAPDATSWGLGHLEVYVRGIGNLIHDRWQLNSPWSPWEAIGSPPGGASSDPAVTTQGAQKIDVLVRGADNAIWYRAYNGGWANWQSLGGALASGPDVTSWGVGHVEFYVRAANNTIADRWKLNGPWSAWENIGAPPGGATSDPAVVTQGAGRIDVFVRGSDAALWHRSYNGGWGNWVSLGGVLVSGPDALSWSLNHMDVYVRGLDNAVFHRVYTNGAWGGWIRVGTTP